MLREYQSEIEKLKQMIEKGGFEGGEVVPSEVQNHSPTPKELNQYIFCLF